MPASASPFPAPLVLIIDDDPTMREACAAALTGAGYRTVTAKDGAQGWDMIARERPALILLDVDLPKASGWEILKRLQSVADHPPVIMMTGATAVDDRVRGLNGGAEDYLCKPCDLREFLARVHRVLERLQPAAQVAPVLQLGATTVDLARRQAFRAGQPFGLTRTEYSLLEIMARTPGRPVSRDRLLGEIWGYGPRTHTRTVDTHIWRLRQKLCEVPSHPRWIHTVAAADGYSLVTATRAA
jgi:two-component system response regulator MprA